MYYKLVASRGARLHCFILQSTFFYLPKATLKTRRRGPIQEVDFGNKSVQTNPGVRRVSGESVLGT